MNNDTDLVVGNINSELQELLKTIEECVESGVTLDQVDSAIDQMLGSSVVSLNDHEEAFRDVVADIPYKRLFVHENHVEQVFNPNKIGRNDPCPCGSSNKYKRCCI